MTALQIHYYARKIAKQCAALPPPVIIAATGGSGTRLFQQIFSACGIYMGHVLNEPGDAQMIEPVVNHSLNPLLSLTGRLDYTPQEAKTCLHLVRDLLRAIDRHLQHRPQSQKGWGWKHPRSYFLLPLLNQYLPDMRFIHVVRDGRDMAFSNNQNQPTKHFNALFGEDYVQDCPKAAMKMWAKCNLEVASFGEKQMQSRYLRIRIEDICTNPAFWIQTMLDFAGLGSQPIDDLCRFVSPPSSLGRWKIQSPEIIEEISAIGKETLSHFGYLPTDQKG